MPAPINLKTHEVKDLSGVEEVGYDQKGKKRQSITYHLYTLYLFTASDFKTVIFPQSVFALAFVLSQSQMRGQPCFSDIGYRLPHMAIWLWLHLLIEDISNQRMPESITEDEINKPWRPISSKRLNPAEAKNILRIGIILAMGLSLSLGNFVPSVTLMAMIWQYNDLDGSNGAWRRNILTAAGLGCFSWGAVVALSTAPLRPENEELLRNWILLSSVVILTTIQVQDFPDTAGDIARGRSTMPLIYGETWSRWMTATFILLWSIGPF
ncbi:hypothetical protein F4821DRAFT_257372 [Hypoxylon rubiginosum]|uniref:Uncharacterized protein n=1 Tax=Hypoxylon rubiginosum TaxID=110542 RepID=A0ACC0D893_9PEZI|nr:hypothetical protein F4821DRAFT_257372 [Hypoxylon rubiginosum]